MHCHSLLSSLFGVGPKKAVHRSFSILLLVSDASLVIPPTL